MNSKDNLAPTNATAIQTKMREYSFHNSALPLRKINTLLGKIADFSYNQKIMPKIMRIITVFFV